MKKEQYVCLACGFNMVGFHPDTCGAQKGWFITARIMLGQVQGRVHTGQWKGGQAQL